ncbi:MAG: ribonuclease P protein component [Bdellovibrionota bacterium]
MVPSKPGSEGKKFGLPPSSRIRKRSDFNRLRKNSQKWVSRHWILYYSKNELGFPRLALSISVKYGNAVERNRYRRWLREAFRLHKAQLPAMDLHFIARQKPANCLKKRYIEELNADFEKLLHRLR